MYLSSPSAALPGDYYPKPANAATPPEGEEMVAVLPVHPHPAVDEVFSSWYFG
jgi:hypothetical protein